MVVAVGEADRTGVGHPLVLPPRPRPGVLKRIDAVGVSAVLGMAWSQPSMLAEVVAADSMDVGLALRSVDVGAIRAGVSGCHANHPSSAAAPYHVVHRADRGPLEASAACQALIDTHPTISGAGSNMPPTRQPCLTRLWSVHLATPSPTIHAIVAMTFGVLVACVVFNLCG